MLSLPKKLADKAWVLGNPLFTPILIAGEQYILIEAGIRSSSQDIIQQFKQLNIQREKLTQIIIMHVHADHVTGWPLLKAAFPQVKAVASENAAKPLSNQKVIAGFSFEDDHMDQVLLKKRIISSLPETSPDESPIPLESTLSHGEHIDLGPGCNLEILATPGHSPCSISVYWPEEEALFISDAAGFISSPRQIFPCFFTGYQQYIDSLQLLKDKNARFLATAHGGLYYGTEAVSSFLDWAIETAWYMQEKIFKHLNDSVDTEIIVDNIMQEYYRDDLTIYSQKNIRICGEALIKRVKIECF